MAKKDIANKKNDVTPQYPIKEKFTVGSYLSVSKVHFHCRLLEKSFIRHTETFILVASTFYYCSLNPHSVKRRAPLKVVLLAPLS